MKFDPRRFVNAELKQDRLPATRIVGCMGQRWVRIARRIPATPVQKISVDTLTASG